MVHDKEPEGSGTFDQEIQRRLRISGTKVRRYLKSGKVPQYHRDPVASIIEPFLSLVRELPDRHNLPAVMTY